MSALHIATGLAACLAGFVIVMKPKATRAHRVMGYVYVVLMMALNVTALYIYKLTGHFGPFHAGAIVNILSIFVGIVPVVIRRPARAWLQLHVYLLGFSYVGLLGALMSEIAVLVLRTPVILTSTIATIAVTIVGTGFLAKLGPPAIRRYEQDSGHLSSVISESRRAAKQRA